MGSNTGQWECLTNQHPVKLHTGSGQGSTSIVRTPVHPITHTDTERETGRPRCRGGGPRKRKPLWRDLGLHMKESNTPQSLGSRAPTVSLGRANWAWTRWVQVQTAGEEAAENVGLYKSQRDDQGTIAALRCLPFFVQCRMELKGGKEAVWTGNDRSLRGL